MLIRPLVLLLMSKYFQIRALYFPGSSNAGADSLSPFRVIRSRSLGPEAFIIPDIPNMNFHMVISKLE